MDFLYPCTRHPCVRVDFFAPLHKGPFRKGTKKSILAQGTLSQGYNKIDPCARVPCIRVLVKCLVQGLTFLLPCTRDPYARLSSCKKGSNSLGGKNCRMLHMPIYDPNNNGNRMRNVNITESHTHIPGFGTKYHAGRGYFKVRAK